MLPLSALAQANQEDDNAYQRAYGEFMTTVDTFERFRFEDGITRQEAARFLVMGAEALGLDLVANQTCVYSDMDDADPSLIQFVSE